MMEAANVGRYKGRYVGLSIYCGHFHLHMRLILCGRCNGSTFIMVSPNNSQTLGRFSFFSSFGIGVELQTLEEIKMKVSCVSVSVRVSLLDHVCWLLS